MWSKLCFVALLLNCVRSESNNSKSQNINFIEDHTVYEDELSVDSKNDMCGIMSQSSGLIQGGNFSQRHDFPWMAVITTVNNYGIWSHKGSGSLISSKHVIAKARSVSFLDTHKYWIPFSADRVQIYLGTTKPDYLSEEGSLKVSVASIQVYPNARKISAFSIFNFALITLENYVTFNDFIKPICLWNFDENFENELIDKAAYAVGYGVDESGSVSHTRKHTRVTITSESACMNEFREEIEAGRESKLFCIIAIESDKDSPCHYDSQLYVKIDSVWYLKGILCSARMYMGFRVCAVSYPILAEDISPYVDWINERIRLN